MYPGWTDTHTIERGKYLTRDLLANISEIKVWTHLKTTPKYNCIRTTGSHYVSSEEQSLQKVLLYRIDLAVVNRSMFAHLIVFVFNNSSQNVHSDFIFKNANDLTFISSSMNCSAP
jgi:hypothetical protein